MPRNAPHALPQGPHLSIVWGVWNGRELKRPWSQIRLCCSCRLLMSLSFSRIIPNGTRSALSLQSQQSSEQINMSSMSSAIDPQKHHKTKPWIFSLNFRWSVQLLSHPTYEPYVGGRRTDIGIIGIWKCFAGAVPRCVSWCWCCRWSLAPRANIMNIMGFYWVWGCGEREDAGSLA